MIDIPTLTRALVQAPISVVFTDRNGTIEYVNPYFEKITGYTSAEVIGQNPRVLKSGLQPPEFYADLWQTILSGREWRGELANKTKSGELFWERTTILPVFDDAGTITHFAAVKENITEERAAREHHRNNEERFELALRGANDGLWDWDLRTNEVYYSPRWKAMLGYADEEVEPSIAAFTRLVHPSDFPRAMSAVRAYLEQETDSYEIELRMLHKRGHYVKVLARAFAARNAAGEAYRLVGTHLDITDAKRVEHLHAAQAAGTHVLATATTLMETLPRFLAAVGGNGLWSVGVIWAVDAPSSVLRCLSLWHSPDVDSAGWADAVRETEIPKGEGTAGRAWSAELSQWQEDGAAVALPAIGPAGMRASIAVPVVVDGRIVGVIQFFSSQARLRDERWLRMFEQLQTLALQIVARRRANDQSRRHLVEAERRYRTTLDQCVQGFYEGTPTGQMLFANPAMALMLGYDTPAQMIAEGPGFIDRLYADPERRAQFVAQMHAHGFVSGFEARFKRRDGRVIWVSESSRAVLDSDGNCCQSESFIEDITARKEAEQLKTDFVSFVTHQLRTPLSGIRWMLELAGQEEVTPAVASFIDDAQHSATRLIALVNDLLDISRLEAGRITSKPEPVDLDALAASVLGDLRPIASSKQQAIETTGRAGLVLADPQLLRQAVLNLLSNAIKYTPAAGHITVRAESGDAGVTWSVADTGIGIPEAARSRLFEKFFRADNASVVDTEGTGLGLYLVRLIAERSGGSVACESVEGAGSTFTLSLPAAPAEQAAA